MTSQFQPEELAVREPGMLEALCGGRISWPLWLLKPPMAVRPSLSEKYPVSCEADEWYSRRNLDDSMRN
jgi:hypothetical protein